MKEIKNVLICGLGAIGTIYAEKIQKLSSENLKILVDEKRLDRYLKNPIIFNGKELNFNYILPCEKNFKADLIIIATKYDGLFDAISNIENSVGENTVILSLLNGITSEKYIIQRYGAEKVLYSYFIGHSAVREGRKITQDGVNKIVFGHPDVSDNIKRVKSFFDKAEINYEIPDDIIYSMWLKFMLNVSSNQTSALFGFTFKQMKQNAKCMKLILNLMQEVKAVAKAERVKNPDKMIDDAIKIFNTMSPNGKTSMLQDIEAGRKTEVDIFAGTVCEYGQKYQIPTPYNKIIKELIEIKQES